MKNQNLKSIIGKYLLEILIIFIGISISFMFDEWREDRKDKETARKHLSILKKNLGQDTFMLAGMTNAGRKIILSIDKLVYTQNPQELKDSIDYYIDNAASYAEFKANLVAYEEIKLNASTILLTDDTLKQLFLAYYTNIVPYCNEWTQVYKTTVMDQLIPEMTNHFPVVPDSLGLISSDEKIRSLRNKKLRNLLLQCSTYKKEVVKTFGITRAIATKLLQRVDKELQTQ